MKLAKLNPKRFFIRSKDRSTVSKSPAFSFGSASSSSGQDCIKNSSISSDGGGGGSVTPTSILPDVSSPYSYVEILQAFKLIDRDNDGAVSRHDLESLLSRLGPDPLTEDEISVMIQEVDCDGDGAIRLEELASRLVSSDPSRDSAELKETFEFFDADRDGLISAEELLRVFSTIGDDRCTLDDCKRMIADVDEDGDGFVCFTEFSRMMDLQR
ncbi:hypothetical protein CARUB_v10014618mg [Capsella rubella]|uniref:EF-hand domain-containing protein n=1 Tax=Capsella rubella TaxID=81985 RepID=R0HVW5_9BRAS|nr:probable calcium-binding protein CML36 [Capsella rubella]EOA29520.1 hypothetical protein CARUB_v10014618mg [Capsella rubella]